VSDEFTVPLCRVHHRELHRQGNERAWWTKANIDPMPIALRFWQQTKGVSLAASGDRTYQHPKIESIEDPIGAGIDSAGNAPATLCDVANGSTAR
jgi:hypothetical protein